MCCGGQMVGISMVIWPLVVASWWVLSRYSGLLCWPELWVLSRCSGLWRVAVATGAGTPLSQQSVTLQGNCLQPAPTPNPPPTPPPPPNPTLSTFPPLPVPSSTTTTASGHKICNRKCPVFTGPGLLHRFRLKSTVNLPG
jgi:hypothetical protein